MIVGVRVGDGVWVGVIEAMGVGGGVFVGGAAVCVAVRAAVSAMGVFWAIGCGGGGSEVQEMVRMVMNRKMVICFIKI